jgi:MFS family permease
MNVRTRHSLLSPFRVPAFLMQWPADLLTNIGIEMEILILGWYILVETQSVLLLTVFGALRYLGTLIAPLFGMAGDRFGHRNVLSAMRGTYAFLATGMTILGFAGLLGPMPIFVAATLAGLVRPSDLAMRNALVAVTMPGDQLMGAMGVARTTADFSRIFGPLMGAALMASTGIGTSYLVIAACYIGGVTLTGMGGAGLTHRRAAGVGNASFVREVAEGVGFVWRTPCAHAGMWLAVLVNATVLPLTGGLMPYIARDVYHLDRIGLGMLAACFSVGSLIGSIGVSLIGQAMPASRVMLLSTLVWHVAVLAFVLMPNPYSGGVMLVVSGICQSFCMVPLAVMLLRVSGEQYRGRVMGVRMFAIYGLPMGLLLAGWLIGQVGFTAMAVGYCVAGFAAATAILGWWWRAVWPLDAQGNAAR